MLEIVQADERTLALAGELDLETTHALLERAGPLLDDGGDLALDLSAVSFIDSQGIRAFIQIARALEGRGALLLADPSPEVRNLFEIVGVEDFPNIVVRG